MEFYRKNMAEIDLVVLDMIMPELSGEDVYKKLREINPKIKVLLSSGYSLDGQAKNIMEMGCDGFIQKPFELSVLSEKIGEILGAS